MLKQPTKTAAVVTIFKASEMSKLGKHRIACWLRRTAETLEREGHNLAARFTARYHYVERKRK